MRNLIEACLGVTKTTGVEFEPEAMQLIAQETSNQNNAISNSSINPLEIDLVRIII